MGYLVVVFLHLQYDPTLFSKKKPFSSGSSLSNPADTSPTIRERHTLYSIRVCYFYLNTMKLYWPPPGTAWRRFKMPDALSAAAAAATSSFSCKLNLERRTARTIESRLTICISLLLPGANWRIKRKWCSGKVFGKK